MATKPQSSADLDKFGLNLAAAAAAGHKAPAANEPMQIDKVGVRTQEGGITVRQAGGLHDMRLPVSPRAVPLAKALQNLAKAVNLALTQEFLETPLDEVYVSARVRKGTVEIMQADYFGLGDGFFAAIGKVGRSIQLTFRGPDPASPEGRKRFEKQGHSVLYGIFDLIGRKLNLLQEFEDQVPTYVEQMLDRLEGANMISGWSREDWEISTKVIGLDVVISPLVPAAEQAKAESKK
jgi:hypothetical protein